MDIVLEDPKGWRVGIEIKTAAVVGSEDFKGLRDLGEAGASIFTEELSYTQALEWFLYIPPLE